MALASSATTSSASMSPTSTASASTMTPTPTSTPTPSATAAITAHRISPTSYLSKVFSLVDHPASGLRFLILDCPSDSTLPSVLKVFTSHNVTDVVRVCEPTYATATLAAAGISVHDLPFQDGGVPSAPLIAKYMTVVNAALAKSKSSGETATVAVHCIAGLGRAPLMVALALIEYGMPPLDAITYIRARRRGAFNTAQVKWIDAYKPQGLAAGTAGAGGGVGMGGVRMLRRSRSVESGASGSRGGFMGNMWRKMVSSLSMGRRKSHPGAAAAATPTAVVPANA